MFQHPAAISLKSIDLLMPSAGLRHVSDTVPHLILYSSAEMLNSLFIMGRIQPILISCGSFEWGLTTHLINSNSTACLGFSTWSRNASIVQNVSTFSHIPKAWPLSLMFGHCCSRGLLSSVEKTKQNLIKHHIISWEIIKNTINTLGRLLYNTATYVSRALSKCAKNKTFQLGVLGK